MGWMDGKRGRRKRDVHQATLSHSFQAPLITLGPHACVHARTQVAAGLEAMLAAAAQGGEPAEAAGD